MPTLIKGSNIADGTITVDDINLGDLDTDNVAEGNTNLYYTTARAYTDIDARVTKAFVEALNVDANTLDGNDSSYFTTYTDNAIAALANSAPAALDTLNELAAALGDDENFATTVTNNLASKLDANTDITLTLDGDVSGSATFTNMANATLTVAVSDNSHNHTVSNITDFTFNVNNAIDSRVTQSFVNALSITASAVDADSVALGTDTTGNYVATVTGGNGLTGSGTGEGSTPTLAVGAGNGITVNADSIEVNVSGDSSLTANSTGLFIEDSTLSIATSQLTGDVALGTQTSGNYVATATGGTGVTVTGGTGEGSTPSIAIGQDVSTSANVTFQNVTLGSEPTQALHAATKAYVDEIAEGLKVAPAVELATTANLTATYDNGNNGIGATLTATTNGAFPEIDGVTVSTTEFGQNGILVKDQANTAHNGRYNLTTVGDGSNPWVLTKCSICDEADEIPGSYVFVKDGTLYGGTGWVALVDDPTTFTVGTDAINYVQFSGAGTYLAGTDITLDGTTFNLNATISANTTGTANNATNLNGQAASYYTNASNINAGTLASARLPDLTVGDFAAAAIQTGAEGFTDSDSVLMTAAAVQDKILSYGYSTTTGTVTSVTVSAGSNLTGGGTVTSSGTINLAVTGSPTFTTVTATDFNSTSDIKFKENVVTIENPAEKVAALRGVNYNWKDSGDYTMGVIAQEVEEVIPEVVHTNEEGDKSVNYQAMVGLLIEAVKDLQNQVAELKK